MKKRRKNFIWIIPVLVLGIFASTTILIYTQAQVNTSVKDEEATAVKEGVMTEKQKEHSKLFADYKPGKKISELVSQQSKTKAPRELTITVSPGTPLLNPLGNSKSSYDSLTELTANSDAILIGMVKGRNSQITENGTFIFSDYQFQVEEIIKNNSTRPINLSELETVTRPGGKVLFNGFTVTIVDRSYQNLSSGEKYLLFLKFVPSTGAYQSLDPEGSFLVSGSKVKTLNSSVASKFRDALDLSSFTADIYSTLTSNLRSPNVETGGK